MHMHGEPHVSLIVMRVMQRWDLALPRRKPDLFFSPLESVSNCEAMEHAMQQQATGQVADVRHDAA
jgi:hypothetical protein